MINFFSKPINYTMYFFQIEYLQCTCCIIGTMPSHTLTHCMHIANQNYKYSLVCALCTPTEPHILSAGSSAFPSSPSQSPQSCLCTSRVSANEDGRCLLPRSLGTLCRGIRRGWWTARSLRVCKLNFSNRQF